MSLAWASSPFFREHVSTQVWLQAWGPAGRAHLSPGPHLLPGLVPGSADTAGQRALAGTQCWAAFLLPTLGFSHRTTTQAWRPAQAGSRLGKTLAVASQWEGYWLKAASHSPSATRPSPVPPEIENTEGRHWHPTSEKLGSVPGSGSSSQLPVQTVGSSRSWLK